MRPLKPTAVGGPVRLRPTLHEAGVRARIVGELRSGEAIVILTAVDLPKNDRRGATT